jgi:hypothetical protein
MRHHLAIAHRAAHALATSERVPPGCDELIEGATAARAGAQIPLKWWGHKTRGACRISMAAIHQIVCTKEALLRAIE